MGFALPRYVALKSLSNNKYLRFINEDVSDHGFLQCSGDEFLGLYSKFELEMSQTKFGLYNIRCCYTNKYLVPESSVSPCLVPGANEPNEEDHWSSTLFEAIAVADDSGEDGAMIVQFRHFHSREYATASVYENTTDAGQEEPTASLPDQTIEAEPTESVPDQTIEAEHEEPTAAIPDQTIEAEPDEPTESIPDHTIEAAHEEPTASVTIEGETVNVPPMFSPDRISGGYETVAVPLVLCGRPEGTTPENQKFLAIDLESFFILPKLVAFKAMAATGGQYVGARSIEDRPHLQLASDDIGDPTVVNEVLSFSDGSVSIKSKHFDKIWRSGTGGIVADYEFVDHDEQEEEANNEIRFLPIKLGPNLVALKNAATGKFCMSHTAEGMTKCLNDVVEDATSILKDSIFEVHEPVVARAIYDVRFNFLDARIYEKKVITLAIQSGTNSLPEPTTMTFKLGYTLETRSAWDNSVSFMATGIKTTLKSSVPTVVAEGEIEITTRFDGSYEWGEEIVVSSHEKERTVEFTVPPMTKVGVKVVATQAKCDIPFFYFRRDTLTNGKQVVYAMDDGVYTSINSYGVKYEFTETQV